MAGFRWLAALVALLLVPTAAIASPWGRNYFPNTELITQDGETVRFFDDLIEGKIVAINFIYTSCPDSCPLETAQLMQVQEILGDRLGTDIFFYSISIDPEVDTPPVLKEYKERFGARWTFLTGDEDEIIQLRRKLGLYVEEIQDGSNNHNISMIIGNQATGRWMRRSPLENPYVLADQLGNWLDGWKSPQRGADYAAAPKLRNISPGEHIFRTRCATCHSVTGELAEGALGPDLRGVTSRREAGWLLNWLRAPDQMLEQKDPIAMALYAQWGEVAMPNMRLNRQEADDVLEYLRVESQRVRDDVVPAHRAPDAEESATSDVVAIMNAWVRESHPAATTSAGYMTLVNVGSESLKLTGVESESFGEVEIHEMATVEGLMKMRELETLEIPAGGQTSLAPGGKHLMLREPVRRLRAGDKVEMTLIFESGSRQTVSVKVSKM